MRCVLVFSEADYALAARLLGLPQPQTPAEIAAATPATAEVIRKFAQTLPPAPGQEPDGLYTGITRSLNAYPDDTQPMEKARLASRLRTHPEDPDDDSYLQELLYQVDPETMDMILVALQKAAFQAEEHMDQLSQQRPIEYDQPNLGSNYSVLNAPASNGIPPSDKFQYLS